MGFTTQTFLFIFLPCSIIIYLAVQLLHRTWVSNLVLLAMSLGFYAWSGWDTLLFFVLLNVAVYLMGNLIYYAKRAEAGSRYLRLSVCLLILTLVYYKYAAFLLQELQLLTDWKLTFPEVVVPLGISFVIFTSVSYLMDIHRGDGTPGTLLETFLYLSLFPKLISGPIVRWKDLGPQLRDRRTDMASVTEGGPPDHHRLCQEGHFGGYLRRPDCPHRQRHSGKRRGYAHHVAPGTAVFLPDLL